MYGNLRHTSVGLYFIFDLFPIAFPLGFDSFGSTFILKPFISVPPMGTL